MTNMCVTRFAAVAMVIFPAMRWRADRGVPNAGCLNQQPFSGQCSRRFEQMVRQYPWLRGFDLRWTSADNADLKAR